MGLIVVETALFQVGVKIWNENNCEKAWADSSQIEVSKLIFLGIERVLIVLSIG